MSDLIDRYLDGDLTENEARAFLEAVGRDPDLEAELRTYEQMLAVGGDKRREEPSETFTDEVMRRIAAVTHRIQPTSRGSSMGQWIPRLAWAAGLAVFFGLGQITARMGLDQPSPQMEIGQVDMRTAGGSMRTSAFRVVRLVYAPAQQGVQQVAVAGSFNEWNPDLTPMRRVGNVWTAQLLLPPDSHEYMFVVNGTTWITDPLAQEVRDDGFGRKNAVLDLRL